MVGVGPGEGIGWGVLGTKGRDVFPGCGSCRGVLGRKGRGGTARFRIFLSPSSGVTSTSNADSSAAATAPVQQISAGYNCESLRHHTKVREVSSRAQYRLH